MAKLHPSVEQALALYTTAPRRDRLHVRGREKSCPVAAILAAVPRTGRVLEVGCGHGLVSASLAIDSAARRVSGVDIDGRKIALAQRAAGVFGHPERLSFSVTDGTLPAGPWDAIVIVDVLYLIDRESEQALIAQCAAALAPGGVFVVKETDVVPRWKHRFATLQEFVATRVVRITKGDSLSFTPIADLAADMESAGLDVRVDRVDKGYLHPHAMVVGRAS
jgi:2-polyprenyl-3-methyl-5-hydroxy-6-metoxy-1,4-benzoquinol methylase